MKLSHLNFVSYCLMALLFGLLIHFVYGFYFRLPFADHLDLLMLLERYYDGSLKIGDFFMPHGASHWHAGAYAILVPLAILSHWNTLYEVSVSLLFGLTTFALVFFQIRRSAGYFGMVAWLPLMLLPAAVFPLSIDQMENWIWGWQLSIQMSVFGVIAGVTLLVSPRLTLLRIFFAILLGLLATYNFSTALCYWPLGLMILLFHPGLALARRSFGVSLWALCSVLVGIHYYVTFSGLIRLVQKPAPIWERLAFSLAFVPPYLGSALSRFTEMGVLIALIGVAGILILVWVNYLLVFKLQVNRRFLMPYWGYALFAAGAAIVTGFGRMDFGLRQAAIPRYISFSNFFWLGLVVLAFVAIYHLKGRSHTPSRIILKIVILMVLALKGLNVAYFWQVTRRYHATIEGLGSGIMTYYPDVDGKVANLDRLYPDRKVAERYLELLHRYQLNIFRTKTEN